MAKGSYIYQSEKIIEYNKDRMRFELGDTMVEGGSQTTALTDEEIQAALTCYPMSWKQAKLMLLESLCRRFAYEVDTKTGPLTLELHNRAILWKADYEALKREVKLERSSVPMVDASIRKSAYFYTGMQENERAKGIGNKKV
mgnify:CR=1 FL=1